MMMRLGNDNGNVMMRLIGYLVIYISVKILLQLSIQVYNSWTTY